MKLTIFVTLFLSSMSVLAGGVICKSCPGESEHCIPRPGCSRAASDSFFETMLKNYDSEEELYPTSSGSICKEKNADSVYGISVSKEEFCN